MFEGFQHIPIRGLFQACDLDRSDKFLFPQAQEALHDNWLPLVQWLLRRCLILSSYGILGQRSKTNLYRLYSQIFMFSLRQ